MSHFIPIDCEAENFENGRAAIVSYTINFTAQNYQDRAMADRELIEWNWRAYRSYGVDDPMRWFLLKQACQLHGLPEAPHRGSNMYTDYACSQDVSTEVLSRN